MAISKCRRDGALGGQRILTYECLLLLLLLPLQQQQQQQQQQLLLLLLLLLLGSGDTKHVVDREGRCSLEAGPKKKKIVYASRFVRVILAQGPC